MTRALLQALDSIGFVHLEGWKPELRTDEVANNFGSSVDIRHLLPASNVPKVQTLAPKRVDAAPLNQYSSAFGLGGFPLHSDLAHWAVPPRYLLLRCLHGSTTVSTYLLPVTVIATAIGNDIIRRAVFLPRRRAFGAILCPLPMLFQRSGVQGIRWDSLFLMPFNQAASKVSYTMSAHTWGDSLKTVALVEPGDTLIIDNWHMLHGRSPVDAQSTERKIERVYLETIQG